MPIVRTPDDRFENLPDFPYEPHYVTVNGLRVHYVDEGNGETILCLHGEPTWSYRYRKMVPILSARHRVIAMDFIGFGRSDKFTETREHSHQVHRDVLSGFIDALHLDRITLVVQDFGGVIGLRLATEKPDRFARLVIMNTGLLCGDELPTRALTNYLVYVQMAPDLPVGQVVRLGLAHGNRVSPEVIRAYEAPFPDASYKAGAVSLPMLLPIRPDMTGAEEIRKVRERLLRWHKPALVMFSDEDIIYKGGDKFFRNLIPTAKEQPEIVIHDAGHFLQEERGEEIARHILDFMARTPGGR